MKIDNLNIGKDKKPFIIAELSGNHNQSLEKALSLIELAKESGADAVKIQTYTADTLTIDCDKDDFQLKDPNSLWHGMSMYELYQIAHTPWEWHQAIFDKCKELEIICFSSPFDTTAVDFLETLGCPCYKIGSTESTEPALLKKVAMTGKPVIVSTGMATIQEIGEIVNLLESNGCKEYALLKCTAAYPALPREANLATIPNMADLTGKPIGLSDHTMGIGVAVASIALGATIIEKHFTSSRAEGGVDSAFSMEPAEFKQLVEECNKAYEAIGHIHYGTTKSENSRLSRRSLYIVEDVKKGDVLTERNVRAIRPGYGMPAKEYRNVLGLTVQEDASKGTRLTWELLK
ncbi:pseudaminic acid synthase [Vibrio sp. St2]|uniref:pseudaminic acid synthase n=1 Tax=Vibrio sp. St2 TaxID=2853441 RepID=UPI00248E13F3|nr:pseudaminic acid synthase [Vibrio sp. St2]